VPVEDLEAFLNPFRKSLIPTNFSHILKQPKINSIPFPKNLQTFHENLPTLK
jgi:hypothetical protein